MTLLLDECLHSRVAALLTAAGHAMWIAAMEVVEDRRRELGEQLLDGPRVVCAAMEVVEDR